MDFVLIGFIFLIQYVLRFSFKVAETRARERAKIENCESYVVEGHGQGAGNGETLTVLEATLDGREVADG